MRKNLKHKKNVFENDKKKKIFIFFKKKVPNQKSSRKKLE